MSVGFANAVADGLRYNKVPVTFEPGWETRGNGYVFPNGRPQGLITHHTGDSYGGGLSILVNGRSDLDPPLCNCCTYPDGTIHIIAAQPANHAGASGGPSMGPLPVTRLFNPLVWGNEVMYPGLQPWTPQQYRSARILGGVICGILGHTTPDWVRGHFETSIEGKWDPGIGDGSTRSFNMNLFRFEIWAALTSSPIVGEPMLTDFDISGTGRRVISVTSGSASSIFGQAWLSATLLDVIGPCWIQVYIQGDKGGLVDWKWTDVDLKQTPDNNYKRVVHPPLPDGATKAIVSWDVTKSAGGVVTREMKPK
jgi:hypothetical protein